MLNGRKIAPDSFDIYISHLPVNSKGENSMQLFSNFDDNT